MHASCPEYSGVAERALGIIQNASIYSVVQAPIFFPTSNFQHQKRSGLRQCNGSAKALNRTATTSNSSNKLPHEMWYGKATSASLHPFLRPSVEVVPQVRE